jgi:cell division protein FtsW (lipid II flippase)
MYAIVLSLHNVLRWAVLLTGAYSVLRAGAGLIARGSWLPADDAARRIFPIALDIQFLVGLLLWAFLSPITTSALHSPEHVMSNPVVRFYLVEHGLAAFLGLAFAHIGSARARRLKHVRSRFTSMLVFHGLALVLIAARLPWDRPLLRLP